MFYYGLDEKDNDEFLINKSIAEIEENALGKGIDPQGQGYIIYIWQKQYIHINIHL